jgi:hypothetical protein
MNTIAPFALVATPGPKASTPVKDLELQDNEGAVGVIAEEI